MAGRGLNDAEVQAEMNKMVSFIKQEALEKAREIKVKADEEFNIEKAKIVRQETVAIEAFFQKKVKQAEIQRKIQQSNHINKTRLRVLQARQQVLADLLQEAAARLTKLSSDRVKYALLLQQLCLQGFYTLLEDEVTVQCRRVDVELIATAIAEAKKTYEARTKKTLKVHLDKENFVSETSAGGVIVHAMDGRIKVSNTLESRLEILAEAMLPEMRVMLFGHSPSRKFFN